ncbi:MAG: hypothetical protein LBD36_00385 [Holosporales bacterium]|jgi:hypothetical protein|nr:hypothetical protein [Holosporales bacterium]
MVEFSILSVIRELIGKKGIGKSYGLSLESVYVMEPVIIPRLWPAIFLDLEESWLAGVNSNIGRMSLKISVLSNSADGRESLDIANQLCQLFDGSSLDIEDTFNATLKMNSCVVDIKKLVNTPRKVEQYYEALIQVKTDKCALETTNDE